MKNKKVKVAEWVITVIGLLGVFAMGFITGKGSEQIQHMYDSPITVDQALDYMRYAQSNHQYYVDHPEQCNELIGDAEFHELWVQRYGQIADLILTLSPLK